MATRFQFVDDSGETRLAGFLQPEPGGSIALPVTITGPGTLTIVPTDDSLTLRVKGGPGTTAEQANLLEVRDENNAPMFTVDAVGTTVISNGIMQTNGLLTQLGFFGAGPNAQPAAPVTLDDVIAALKTLGLVAT